MSAADLAALNAANQLATLRRALDDERRGRAIKAAQRGRTDAFDRNIARLEAEVARLTAEAA